MTHTEPSPLVLYWHSSYHAWITPMPYEGSHRDLLRMNGKHQGRYRRSQYAAIVERDSGDISGLRGSLIAEAVVITVHGSTSTVNVTDVNDGDRIAVLLVNEDGTEHARTARVADDRALHDPRPRLVFDA